MTDDKPQSEGSGKSYTVGDIGSGARVQIGEHLSWVEAFNNTPNDAELVRQFREMIKEISEHPQLDKDTQAISISKTEAVAEGLANARNSPGKLKTALLDAQAWFTNTASWGWDRIKGILNSEAAKKTIETITEEGIKIAIKAMTGVV